MRRTATGEIVYPESDGQPIALGSAQVRWVHALYLDLAARLWKTPDVFVAAGLIWYPVEGRLTRIAPVVMVAFGRPKGNRGSYRQWDEGGVAPQVVFEALSDCEKIGRRERQAAFYSRHGVEEFYEYHPLTREFTVRLRAGGRPAAPVPGHGFVSPRLGVRFEYPPGEDMQIIDAEIPFENVTEYDGGDDSERRKVIADIERMRTKLRALGIDPDGV